MRRIGLTLTAAVALIACGTLADRLQAAPIGPPEDCVPHSAASTSSRRHKSLFGTGGVIVGTMMVGKGRAFTGAAMPSATA